MTDARAHRLVKIDCEPLAPIELRKNKSRHKALRWNMILVWFMRVVSLLWIVHSLLNWCEILGVVARDAKAAALPIDQLFAVTSFFAIANPIAAVGLWLATPWGGVAWLVAVMAQMFTAVMMPGLFDNEYLVLATNGLLILCYFVVTYAASREHEDG